MYYPGLDVILSLIYVFIIYYEAKDSKIKKFWDVLGIATVWQAPALGLMIMLGLGLDQTTNLAYYAVFMLEIWETPVLPILSYFSSGFSYSYYTFYLFATPCLMILYLIPMILMQRRVKTTNNNPLNRLHH